MSDAELVNQVSKWLISAHNLFDSGKLRQAEEQTLLSESVLVEMLAKYPSWDLKPKIKEAKALRKAIRNVAREKKGPPKFEIGQRVLVTRAHLDIGTGYVGVIVGITGRNDPFHEWSYTVETPIDDYVGASESGLSPVTWSEYESIAKKLGWEKALPRTYLG